MVGLDSNISADEVSEFKKRLKSVQSLDFGEEHVDQVTDDSCILLRFV